MVCICLLPDLESNLTIQLHCIDCLDLCLPFPRNGNVNYGYALSLDNLNPTEIVYFANLFSSRPKECFPLCICGPPNDAYLHILWNTTQHKIIRKDGESILPDTFVASWRRCRPRSRLHCTTSQPTASPRSFSIHPTQPSFTHTHSIFRVCRHRFTHSQRHRHHHRRSRSTRYRS